MKMFLTGLLVLSSVVASATSIRDVRLAYSEKSMSYSDTTTGLQKSVAVFGDGAVMGFSCPTGASPLACETHHLGRVSKRTLMVIERQIAGAEMERVIYPDPRGIHCMAMPNRSFDYSADNDKVLLKSGSAPCGDVTYRDGIHSQKLIRRLNGYMDQLEEALAE